MDQWSDPADSSCVLMQLLWQLIKSDQTPVRAFFLHLFMNKGYNYVLKKDLLYIFLQTQGILVFHRGQILAIRQTLCTLSILHMLSMLFDCIRINAPFSCLFITLLQSGCNFQINIAKHPQFFF